MRLSAAFFSMLAVKAAQAVTAAAHFEYEQDHLTEQNIEDILHKRLPKQSRIQSSNTSDYISPFLFSPVDVTSDHNTTVSYEFQGPDNCKVFPGDEKWPSKDLWSRLERVTQGGLIKPVPMAHVCYSNGTGEIDQAACDAVTENWTSAQYISSNPIEAMSPTEIGMTCQPFSLFDTKTCTQGGYPSYTVNVSSVAQIQLAVNFARNTGIRFVIMNTGHDFLGKSSGAGALSVWMHGMKDLEFVTSYEGSGWEGAAVRAGAGVQGFELHEFAHENDVNSNGGICRTVGIVGGWAQGGGHGPLAPLFGMGADDVLSLEVVTSDGRFVTANADQNADLFWALRGGGGGTFGVVTSATLKARPKIPVTATTWSFSYPNDVSEATFKQALRAWLSYFPRYADMGLYSYLYVLPLPDGGRTFTMDPLIAANQSVEAAQAIIQPWLDDIAALGIDLKPEWKHYESFKGVADNFLSWGGANNYGSITGNRLFPRANFEGGLFNATFDAIWTNIQEGYVVLPYNIAPTLSRGGQADNAVNPAWREAVAFVIMAHTVDYTQPPEEIMRARYNFTQGPMQRFRDVSVGAGSYGNEGDRLEPNFQWAYYGRVYPRLLELKRRFDPGNLFYAVTSVGSEFLEVRSFDGVANENGRLCRREEPEVFVVEGVD